MGSLLTKLAEQAPNAPAITIGSVTCTRAELEERANRRALAFASMGVAQDSLVAIMLPNGFEFFETTFALWKLGATPLSMSHRLPGTEAEQLIDLTDPMLIVGVSPGRFGNRLTLAAGYDPEPSFAEQAMPIRVSGYWKAIASGGSSGRPKVVFDHMCSIWDPASVVLGREPGDIVLNPGPLYHNAPFTLMHTALLGGCHVIAMEHFDAAEWLRLVEQHRVQWAYLVPTMMNRIWRLPEREAADLSSLRRIVHMAAPCPAWLKRSWIEWLGPDRVWETYAGTESIGGCFNSGSEWLERPGTVGRAMGGCTIEILDEEGNPLPCGEVGEIFFSPSATSGAGFHYVGGEIREAGARKGYGDLGYLDEEGYLFIADRRTDLVISGGANIYPAEVEATIEEHPLVRSCVVIGLPDDDLGQRVHAIVDVTDNLDLIGEPELLAFVRKRLVHYKVPRTIEFVSSPLRDDAGKVRRSQLRAARLTPP